MATSTTAVSTTKTTTTTGSTPIPGPNTGDSGNIWFWAVLMIASALGLRYLLLHGKKRARKEEPAA
ncbi:MAG: hypothetical protein LBS96_06615 [Oscillospiraceae bacterium]|nr:hypothetical protein [Oscillospiraceae bacterium]